MSCPSVAAGCVALTSPWAGTALRVTSQGWGIPCLTPDMDGLMTFYIEFICSSLYPILTLGVVNSRVLPSNPSVLNRCFTYPGLLIETKLTTRSDLSEQSQTLSVTVCLPNFILPSLTGEHCLHHHPKRVPGILFSLQEFQFCLISLGWKEIIQCLLSFHISRPAPPFVASRAVLLISESLSTAAQDMGPESPTQFTRNIWRESPANQQKPQMVKAAAESARGSH